MVEVCRYLGIEDPRKVKLGADDEEFISEESEDEVVSVLYISHLLSWHYLSLKV